MPVVGGMFIRGCSVISWSERDGIWIVSVAESACPGGAVLMSSSLFVCIVCDRVWLVGLMFLSIGLCCLRWLLMLRVTGRWRSALPPLVCV